jgi:formate dehydrogenase iron-sulfur subunit
MNKKILIDLTKLRDLEEVPADAILREVPLEGGLRTLREEATFEYTCRRCKDAPCMSVCPSEALEKDDSGRIVRHVNLCIRCKSCITICPFGTMMDDLFEKKPRKRIFNLDNEAELKNFIKVCPVGVVSMYDGKEDPDNHIHKLNDRVMIKELIWNH